MALSVVFKLVTAELIYEVSSCFRSVCKLRMTVSPGFLGSFPGLLLVKPFCYLRENVTGGILTTSFKRRPSQTDVVFGIGRIYGLFGSNATDT